MEGIEKALREMFEVNKAIALDRDPKGWVASIKVEAAKACAWIALALAEIQEQKREEEAE